MITHERLKELIEQKATIWSNKHCPIKLINDSDHKIDLLELNKCLYVAEKFECQPVTCWWEDCTISFNYLYESEEDSKLASEFACIERTERLVLPTWEEWQKYDEFDFLDKEGFSWVTYITGDNEIIMANGWEHFTFENNKEGYLLACRKAKELFLGEE